MRIGLAPVVGTAPHLGISRPIELLQFRGKAVIEYNIDHLIEADVKKIVVVTGEGKEVVQNHLRRRYPRINLEFALYRPGQTGALIDAIKASYEVVRGHDVYLGLAHTFVWPNPFLQAGVLQASALQAREWQPDLTLLCFKARGSRWQYFSVVDTGNGRVVDRPHSFISRVCWGALMWQPAFTEKVITADDLTAVINQTGFAHRLAISEYKDIAVEKVLSRKASNPGKTPVLVEKRPR